MAVNWKGIADYLGLPVEGVGSRKLKKTDAPPTAPLDIVWQRDAERWLGWCNILTRPCRLHFSPRLQSLEILSDYTDLTFAFLEEVSRIFGTKNIDVAGETEQGYYGHYSAVLRILVSSPTRNLPSAEPS